MHDSDAPISKSELRQYADKTSPSRLPKNSYTICRESLLRLLRFIYDVDSANPGIQIMIGVMARNRMDKDDLSQRDLNRMIAGKDTLVGFFSNKILNGYLLIITTENHRHRTGQNYHSENVFIKARGTHRLRTKVEQNAWMHLQKNFLAPNLTTRILMCQIF